MVSRQQYATVKLYIEGGGEQNRLKRECRRAFASFFERVGFRGRMPRVVACGSRNEAFRDFCSSLKSADRTKEIAFLLVDSEDAVVEELQNKPWEHLRNRDHWTQPDAATNEQVHLMIQCMENLFLADTEALRRFFGQGFNSNALPSNTNIERIAKSDVLRSLENATRHSQKGSYGKGDHSFKILEEVDAMKVVNASSSAKRLILELDKVL
ncbi:DUF4276 family protein [Desulfosporosinus metallidurans]|uniref:DUF4276 family protein n=1 Tax=Desulfosporosinus metallidurans TaxID=1888891 RepID=A0A1Q8QU42_9FIRM|nr:DUF4276 family protein [Desulfosporosinus metallidurans]OLN30822.1 hypothetical protein DSOL_2940 [Desulfosporosinus metallidurans]